MYKKTYKKGFTLVELIIVIAIIGILAAVLIPSITGYINKAKLSNDRTDVANMNKILATTLDIEIENTKYLEAPDIRAIINEKSGGIYDFIPRSAADGYSYWYNKSKKQIVLAKASELETGLFGLGVFADDGRKGNTVEEFIPGYLFLDKGGSKIAILVSDFRSITSKKNYQDNIDKLGNTAGISILADLKGFSRNQLESLQSHFEQFNPTDTLFINDFTSYTLTTNSSKKYVVFSDGIMSIPANAASGISQLPNLVAFPYSLKFIEENAFTSIASSTKLFFYDKEKISVQGNPFSVQLLNANSSLSGFKQMVNLGYGNKIQVLLDFSPTPTTEQLDPYNTVTYTPFTVSVNPQITLEGGEKVLSSSARFEYKEDDNGKITMKVKLYNAEGIVGEKTISYIQPKDLKISFDDYTLQFENFASAFQNSMQDLKYSIQIGNSEPIFISASAITGIRHDYFIGDTIFAPKTNFEENEVFTGSLKDYSGNETEIFYPKEEIITSQITQPFETISSNTRKIEYTDKNSVIITYYGYDSNGNLLKYQEERGIDQTVTVTDEKLFDNSPDYDLTRTTINAQNYYIKTTYILSKYVLDSTLRNSDDSLDITITAMNGDQQLISKTTKVTNVEEYFVKQVFLDSINEDDTQSLTNYEYETTLGNSLFVDEGDSFEAIIQKNFPGAYLQSYSLNDEGTESKDVYKIKIPSTANTPDGDAQMDLVYIIELLEDSKMNLKVSVGYHFDSDQNKYVKDNEDINYSINYAPIELPYYEKPNIGMKVTTINNRTVGNLGTAEQPFLFQKDEVLVLNDKYFKFNLISDSLYASKNYSVDTIKIEGEDYQNGVLDTILNDEEDLLDIRSFDIIYLNGNVQIAKNTVYYKVVPNFEAYINKINGRIIYPGQTFIFRSGEKISLYSSTSVINYFYGVDNKTANLNAEDINWDELMQGFKFTNDGEKTPITSNTVIKNIELYINDTPVPIDFTTKTFNHQFGEGESGVLKFVYSVNIGYLEDSVIKYSGFIDYVTFVDYKVIDGPSNEELNEHETFNALKINNRTYTRGAIFDFFNGEKLGTGSSIEITINDIMTGGTKKVSNTFIDLTHDGMSNATWRYINFSISNSPTGEFDEIDESYVFSYENGSIKNLKMEVYFDPYPGNQYTFIIPYVVNADSESNDLFVRMINGVMYEDGMVYEFEKGSIFGKDYLTQFYYFNYNGQSATTVNSTSTSVKFSFNEIGPFVTADLLLFDQDAGYEGTIYVQYTLNGIIYSCEIPFKVVDVIEESDIFYNVNSYLSKINKRTIKVDATKQYLSMPFEFLRGEKLSNAVADYQISYNNGSKENPVTPSNLVRFEIWKLDSIDNKYKFITIENPTSYIFGQDGDSGYLRVTTLYQNVYYYSVVPFVVKDIIINSINNRVVEPGKDFELYSYKVGQNLFREEIKTIGVTYALANGKASSIINLKEGAGFTLTSQDIFKITVGTYEDYEMSVPFRETYIEKNDFSSIEIKGTEYLLYTDRSVVSLFNNRLVNGEGKFKIYQLGSGNIEELTSEGKAYQVLYENKFNHYYTVNSSATTYYKVNDDTNLIQIASLEERLNSLLDESTFNGEGIITMYFLIGDIYYESSFEFEITSMPNQTAKILLFNGIYYYDDDTPLQITNGGKLITGKGNTAIGILNDDGYYLSVNTSTSMLYYYDSENPIPSYTQFTPGIFSDFGSVGTSGWIKIVYNLNGINYVAERRYIVVESVIDTNSIKLIKINNRNYIPNSTFTFFEGEYLFTKNGENYSNNSESSFEFLVSGTRVSVNFNLPSTAGYAYYVIPSEVLDSDGSVPEFENGIPEEYKVYDSNYCFTNTISSGVLRIVYTYAKLGQNVTLDVPFEVVPNNTTLSVKQIAVLSTDLNQEYTTVLFNPNTRINVLQGQSIKASGNTKFNLIYPNQVGKEITLTSTALKAYFVDSEGNEVEFKLSTNTEQGDTFVGSIGTEGKIRFKYVDNHGIECSVDINYRIVEA